MFQHILCYSIATCSLCAVFYYFMAVSTATGSLLNGLKHICMVYGELSKYCIAIVRCGNKVNARQAR